MHCIATAESHSTVEMEEGYWLSLSLGFIALSTTILAFWFLNPSFVSGGNRKPKKQQLPPGPWALPIIGSLHHLFLSRLPHHRTMMQLSRRHGPLMLLRLGEVPTVVVSGAEAAELVMKAHDPAFASRPRGATQDIFGGGRDITFAPYGAAWRQMRKICVVELLSARQVRRMEHIRADEAGSIVRSIAVAGGVVNVGEKVMRVANDVVSRAVFGGKFARRQEEYLRELDEALALAGGFCLVDLFPSCPQRLLRWISDDERRMRRSHGRIQQIIDDIVDERKAAARAAAASSDEGGRRSVNDDEDLLEVLLRLQEEDSLEFPLTTDTMGGILFDMFAAATDTTGTVLEWAMSELVRHPKAMAKAQTEIREVLGDRAVITNSDFGELHYMRMVIKETLRMHPPAPLIPRTTREDCKIMGYDMLKGTNVYINVFAVSRDPKYWKNPEEFDPERFENLHDMDYHGTHFEYTPFGAGRRQCPGILFGVSTIEIVLANLLYHFDWVLPGGLSPESLDMSEKFGITVSRRSDLQLRAIQRLC
ncbi:premnaspirodiene oxygenase isoform X2 [Brachypodium distachyon]|uniref:Cytochrome P450 n=1 Tax=Brachypodium distachyon TaxID=15368 RepID=A0A0Q3L1Q3_BRADI|nr:premnaspirodiene oxygenase isoform X2 [Brachypodium distachyon]KQJ86373.1 hypothetical protein BRADI_4g05000v3 [Brachypodium distachyon]|eukprot:XP_010237180.1 premnaspirodiene oxygenase isoform X2 [Brachypodium distachyon]